MLHFATQKLLGGPNHTRTNTGDTSITPTDRSIACLSVRFPLEFDFSDPNARSLVRKQIEHHMRLCTIATSGFEVLFSTVGSEPLLAEAASHYMMTSGTSPIRELSDNMDQNCINHGERGELVELVAALLIMQARDAVTKGSNRRWIYVREFMESLLGASAAQTTTVLPYKVHSNEDKKTLADGFKDARMWFNHVVKIQKADLINVQYLWRFITRGAMILCANNQPGVDIVIPVCYSDNKLSQGNVTAILIQVKNNQTFGENIRGYLFDAMDPFHINLFNKDMRSPLPIIRMVFALASKQDVVKWVVRPQALTSTRQTRATTRQSEQPDLYTSYDLWCAGISQSTFPVIGDDESALYQKILDRTRFPGHGYPVSKVHEVEYPEEVAKSKAGLLRSFDALVAGDEADEDPNPEGGLQRKGKQRAV